MTAAPGSSILPSRSRSRRLPPRRVPGDHQVEHLLRPLRSAPSVPFEQLRQQRHGVDRADVLGGGGVHRRRSPPRASTCPSASRRARFLSSRSTRAADAVAAPLVVGGAEARGDRLVPVGHRAVLGVRCPAGASTSARKPFHSYLPLPSVSRPGSTLFGRIGSRPLVYSAIVLVVDVERVERLRGLRGGLEERLRARRPAVREAAEEELVEHVLAVARALRARSRPSCR